MFASLFNLAGPDLIIILFILALFVGVPIALVVGIVVFLSRRKQDQQSTPPPLDRHLPPDAK